MPRDLVVAVSLVEAIPVNQAERQKLSDPAHESV